MSEIEKINWSILIGEEKVHESTLEIDGDATKEEIGTEIMSVAIRYLMMGESEEDV